jgi:hypothetical protein
MEAADAPIARQRQTAGLFCNAAGSFERGVSHEWAAIPAVAARLVSIFDAAAAGDVDLVKCYISGTHGCCCRSLPLMLVDSMRAGLPVTDINCIDDDGLTPLHHAALWVPSPPVPQSSDVNALLQARPYASGVVPRSNGWVARCCSAGDC